MVNHDATTVSATVRTLYNGIVFAYKGVYFIPRERLHKPEKLTCFHKCRKHCQTGDFCEYYEILTQYKIEYKSRLTSKCVFSQSRVDIFDENIYENIYRYDYCMWPRWQPTTVLKCVRNNQNSKLYFWNYLINNLYDF
jgi:hypothetical protein